MPDWLQEPFSQDTFCCLEVHSVLVLHFHLYTYKAHKKHIWNISTLAVGIHAKYNTRNGDFNYTLSLFLSEPMSWINRYEWRKLDEREINVSYG
jgi:hypothetical protein